MTISIFINRDVIARNQKNRTFDPCIVAQDHKSKRYGHRIDILDGNNQVIASVVQSQKLSGVTAWIETEAEVKVISYEERKKPRVKVL